MQAQAIRVEQAHATGTELYIYEVLTISCSGKIKIYTLAVQIKMEHYPRYIEIEFITDS